MRVAVVTSYGKDTGFGHVTRSMHLAQRLLDRRVVPSGADVQAWLQGPVDRKPSVHATISVSWVAEDVGLVELLIAIVEQNSPTHLILDLPHYPDWLLEYIRALALKTILFGVPLASVCGDIVVNVSESGDRYSGCRKIGQTLVFSGLRYVFLAPEVLAARDSHLSEHLQALTVVFGGTDPQSLLLPVLEQLIDTKWSVTAACSEHTPVFAKAQHLIAAHREIQVLPSFTDFIEFNRSSDVLITSPGNLLFEAICVGIPVLCYCQNAKQWDDFGHWPFVYLSESIADIQMHVNQCYESHGTMPAWYQDVGKGLDELTSAIVNP